MQHVILVVDDHPIERKILDLLANKYGYIARLATNGIEALRILHYEDEISAVLMDWRMPIMDGLECTRWIRTSERGTGGRIPVIAITACVLDGDKQKCLDAGMDDYLSKPFTAEEFHQVVDRWL